MDCDWDKGMLTVLRAGAMHGTAFGIETADRHSFFTFAPERCGVRFLEDVALLNGPDKGERRVAVEMAEGQWNARLLSECRERSLLLSASLTTVSPSLFQDFVLRAVFSRNSFVEAEIGSERFGHRESNVYHQHPVRSASLSGPAGRAVIRVTEARHGAAFGQVLYIRDAPEGWVVHARLIPAPPYAKIWVRWFNRIARISFSDWASRLLLKIPGLADRLWYAAERGGAGALQLQASGLAGLPPETTLSLSMEIEFEQP